MSTAVGELVEVFCSNRFCGFYMKKGRRVLVGRISARAELRCPNCKHVEMYDV